MGKKYIIEKDDNESIWSIYADADGDATIEGVSLTPYTEPDLEQIGKEAYEQGLSDAWKAARKIYDISHEDRLEIFPEASTFVVADICDRYSASEAIEKIRQYEQKQEEQDGLRQNIQTIVDQCGYTLDEIAEVLQKMKESDNG